MSTLLSIAGAPERSCYYCKCKINNWNRICIFSLYKKLSCKKTDLLIVEYSYQNLHPKLNSYIFINVYYIRLFQSLFASSNISQHFSGILNGCQIFVHEFAYVYQTIQSYKL